LELLRLQKVSCIAVGRLEEISKSLVSEINDDIKDEDGDFFYTLDVEGFEDSDKVKSMKKKLTGVTKS
jgi:hypothetical protein